MKKIFILFVIFLCFPVIINAKEITGYLFYGDGCPHCQQEENWFESYENDEFHLITYEVWYNSENAMLFDEVQRLLNNESKGVPYLVIGSKVIEGYLSGMTDESISSAIDYYENNEYIDYVGSYLKGEVIEPTEDDVSKKEKVISIPLLGNVNVSQVSLILVSIILGTVDGFNPCALWILIFLIAMLFNMKDRKKMWILGTIFLVASALVYAIFMVSWLNFSSILNKIPFLRIFIGSFAVIFGILNIVRFIKTKETGCEIVDNKKRNKIMDKIRDIATNKKFILSILGIIVLAVSVNMIELACSLGLPVMFTEILSLNELSTFKYGLYIFIYIFFYMLDDLIIFIIAMRSLKIVGISNKYTKYSHLIGGIILIALGLLLAIKPELLMFNF